MYLLLICELRQSIYGAGIEPLSVFFFLGWWLAILDDILGILKKHPKSRTTNNAMKVAVTKNLQENSLVFFPSFWSNTVP